MDLFYGMFGYGVFCFAGGALVGFLFGWFRGFSEAKKIYGRTDG